MNSRLQWAEYKNRLVPDELLLCAICKVGILQTLSDIQAWYCYTCGSREPGIRYVRQGEPA